MASLVTDTAASSSSSSSIYKVDGYEEIEDGIKWEDVSECYTRLKEIYGFEDDFSTWFRRYEATHFYNTEKNVECFNEKVMNKVIGTQFKAEVNGDIFGFNVKVACIELARDRKRMEKKELYKRCLKQLQDAFETGKPTHFSVKRKDMKNMDEQVQKSDNVTKYGACPICLQDITPNNACILICRRNMGKENVTLRREYMEQACKCTFCSTCVGRQMENELNKLRDDQLRGSIGNTQILPDCPCCKNKYFGALWFKGSIQKTGNEESTMMAPTFVVPYLFEPAAHGLPRNFHHEALHHNGNYGRLFQQPDKLYELYFSQERALTLRKNMLRKQNVRREDVQEAFGLTQATAVNGDDVAETINDLRFYGSLYLDDPTSMNSFCMRMQREFEDLYAVLQRVKQEWLHCNPLPYSVYAGKVYKILSNLKKSYDTVMEEERTRQFRIPETGVDEHEFDPITFGDEDQPIYVPPDERPARVRPRENDGDNSTRPRRRARFNI